MRTAIFAAGAACGLVLMLGAGATRASAGGYGACRAGAAVVDRYGQTGVVLDDSDPSACRVRLSNGTERNYLQWMLSPAGAAPGRGGRGGGGAVQPGNYLCHGGEAGNMRITLTGNRWNGSYAEVQPDGRVTLSNTPGARANMICERQ